ncbi:MAG: lysylphosphatidylglycerol synthase domain-containing protein [Solirubrobacterales bacterium]
MERREPLLHRFGDLASRIGSRPPSSRPLRVALQVGVAVLIFGFLVLTVVGQWDELKRKGVELDLIWLLPALAVLPVFYVLSAVGWELIVRFLGWRLTPVRAQVAWGQPLLARYVPGSVLYLLGRLLLSERAGVPRRVTLASIVYEQALGFASGVAFVSYFLISHPDLEGEPLRWAVLVVVPLSVLLLSPRVFGPLSERLLRAFGREPLPAAMPLRGVIAMLAFYLLNWGVASLGVYFAARSVHFIPADQIPAVGAAQAFGYVAALVTLVAPAGLGVRDAAFAWAVKVALPSGSFAVGAVIALAVRATLTIVELIYVGAVTVLGRRETRAAAKRPGPSAQSGTRVAR